eukprot:758295-Hanusia_phi.AAC.4
MGSWGGQEETARIAREEETMTGDEEGEESCYLSLLDSLSCASPSSRSAHAYHIRAFNVSLTDRSLLTGWRRGEEAEEEEEEENQFDEEVSKSLGDLENNSSETLGSWGMRSEMRRMSLVLPKGSPWVVGEEELEVLSFWLSGEEQRISLLQQLCSLPTQLLLQGPLAIEFYLSNFCLLGGW